VGLATFLIAGGVVLILHRGAAGSELDPVGLVRMLAAAQVEPAESTLAQLREAATEAETEFDEMSAPPFPPGTGPLPITPESFTSLDEARSRVPFTILSPTFLPEPLRLQSVTYVRRNLPNVPQGSPGIPGTVQIVLKGDGKQVHFVQAPVGSPYPGLLQADQAPPTAQKGEVTVQAVRGRWLRGQWRVERPTNPGVPLSTANRRWEEEPLRLYWEKDGFKYMLESAIYARDSGTGQFSIRSGGIQLEDLVRIGNSLR
jgi:hypothetical protein